MGFSNRFKPQLRAEELVSATQAAKSSSKDYAKMTREELRVEEKKMNAQKIITALVIGGMVGLALWSATHHKGGATFLLLLFAWWIAHKNSQNLKSLQAEISHRDTVG
ncbi:hypothetical protein [Hymenobacter sp. APR13]|uniref:hypothetical protein n=1 Tax=Hymenobacter sp. APR13 TaxID=1356852 RepID=UPI0004E04E99|nr:hypothetical protein [Hymenobacter sp. APR13]AII54409.1 hypothetical protein N008_20780 [Hymenobacter sp. APR13]